MKKMLMIKLLAIFCFLSIFFFLVISILAVLGYSVGGKTVVSTSAEVRKQSYLENNNLYATTYRKLLDKYLYDYGYVSMERIVWYLQITNNKADPNSLSFDKWEDAYLKNIDKEQKQMYPTSDMCKMVNTNNYFNNNIGGGLYNDFVDLCSSSYVEEHNLIYTTTYLNLPYIAPLKKETVTGITSMVNEKRNVDLGLSSKEQANVNFHSGWDMSASAETNVYSICDGTVTSVSFTQNENVPFSQQSEPKNKTGNMIKIKCDGTNDIATYVHLYPNSATSQVKVGNSIKQGQMIAKVGTTGQSTGNHLHLSLNSDSGIRLDAFYFINFSENTLYSE